MVSDTLLRVPPSFVVKRLFVISGGIAVFKWSFIASLLLKENLVSANRFWTGSSSKLHVPYGFHALSGHDRQFDGLGLV